MRGPDGGHRLSGRSPQTLLGLVERSRFRKDGDPITGDGHRACNVTWLGLLVAACPAGRRSAWDGADCVDVFAPIHCVHEHQ